MRYIITLFLSLFLFAASSILNINVKESPSSVELLLNFDTPFNGKIAQKRDKDSVEILLKDVHIFAPWQEKVDSDFIYQIDIKPMQNSSLVTFYTVKPVKISAAKSKDGHSLKLTAKPLTPTPTQKDTKDSSIKEYLLWGLMAVLSIVLILILKSLRQKEPLEKKRVIVQSERKNEFSIKFEKPLDNRNKIALITFRGVDYLVIIGSSNILLGKYKEGEIETAEDFEKAIQSQDVEAFKEEKIEEDEIFTTIEEYKKRASGEL